MTVLTLARKRPTARVRLRGNRWRGYFWSNGKMVERTLVASTEGDALRETESIIDALVFGIAPESGASLLLALTPLVPPQAPGCYAIIDERGFVKIGRASNILKRFNQLQGMNPRPLRLVAVLSRRVEAERMLQRRLSPSGHVRGEWFATTPKVVEEICQARSLL